MTRSEGCSGVFDGLNGTAAVGYSGRVTSKFVAQKCRNVAFADFTSCLGIKRGLMQRDEMILTVAVTSVTLEENLPTSSC